MATGRGKIGRMSYAQREKINEMIRDNVESSQVIEFCASEGVSGVTKQNVNSWKQNGYEDWLRGMEMREDMNRNREYAKQLIADIDPDSATAASDAASAIAVDRITTALLDFDTASLNAMLLDKPDKIIGLIGVLNQVRRSDQEEVKLQIKIDEAKRELASLLEAEEAGETVSLADVASRMRGILGV